MAFVSAMINDGRDYILNDLPLAEGLIHYERGLKARGYEEAEKGLMEEYRKACGD